MTTDYRINTGCRLCQGALTRVLDLPDTALANELLDWPGEPQQTFPLYLCKCEQCGHVQLPVVVDPVRLFRSYVYQSSTSRIFVKHLEDFAARVRPSKPGAFVVEIGSNDGTLLAEYKKRGHEVLGIDPAANIAEIAEAKNGVPTLRCFFGRATLSNWHLAGRKADLVLALNVFAHSDELDDIASGVAELLAPEGEFVIECGYLPSMIAKGVYRVIYHEHLSYWHIKPMLQFLKKHGLHLYDAEHVTTQGGSMRYYASKDERAPSEALLRLMTFETPDACDVSRLALNIAADKADLRRELDEAKEAGKKVCGYGCPAQLTTTCAVLGVTRADIAFVCDDNPLKVGKFTPGTFIPIVPTSALIDEKPDVCVIFSANFATDIINRHADFEGEWVVP